MKITNNTVMILSPHFDDAVLSTSNILLNCKETIIYVTIFTKECDFSHLSNDYICYGDLKTRKHEDKIMLEKLKQFNKEIKIEPIYLELPDDIFRKYVDYNVIFNKLCYLLKNLDKEYNFNNIYCPLAIGEHPDHLMTYNACQTLENTKKITYYLDYPYKNLKLNLISRFNKLSINHNETISFYDIVDYANHPMYKSCFFLIRYLKIAKNIFDCWYNTNLKTINIKKQKPNLLNKYHLINSYKSQIKPLFSYNNILLNELIKFPDELYLNYK